MAWSAGGKASCLSGRSVCLPGRGAPVPCPFPAPRRPRLPTMSLTTDSAPAAGPLRDQLSQAAGPGASAAPVLGQLDPCS